MGQLISGPHHYNSNDELINALIKRDLIQTIDVEKVLRSVDRGLYFTDDEKRNAYRDSAWQSDKIHLSAPSVYATILECLELKSGNKFLNIGSGIGYFSTLAGLLLGVNGINHGIEIHRLLIDNADQKLEEFKLNSAAIDYYHFCEPVFIQGNVCEMSTMGFYDKVYCGAGVPVEESQFIMSLIKIGGILVMPLNGSLVKITRKDEHTWKTVELLEVSFTNLVIPEHFYGANKIKFPPVEPLTLQELCRSNIRSLLRENLKNISPNLPMRTLSSSNIVSMIKNLNHDIPFNKFIRTEYGVSEDDLFNLRHIVDSIAGLSDDDEEEEEVVEAYVDNKLENDFDEEVEYSDGDDNDDSNVATDSICTKPHNYEKEFDEILRMENELMNQNQQNRNTAQTSDESTKRKSPEAGCSEQNKTLTGTATEAENSKRMKLNKSPEKIESVPSPSPDGSDLLDTVSIDPSAQEEDTNSLVSFIVADVNHVDEDDDSLEFRKINNSSLNGNSSDENNTICNSAIAEEMKKYCFISERKENELSKLLKGKINLLPIPIPLMTFLNYNLVD